MESIQVCFLYRPFTAVKEYLEKSFSNHPNVYLNFPTSIEEEDLINFVRNADIIISWNISEPVIRAAKKVKLIISPYTGVEHLTKKLRSIPNLPKFQLVNAHGASELIAQHTVAMLLGITNHIVLHHRRLHEGIWVPGGEGVEEDAPSIPLAGKTIGLFGYGKINQKVHKMMANFNTKFAILRRSWSNRRETLPTAALKFELAQLQEFLAQSDILVIAAPLTRETKGIIGKKELQQLGTNSVIINVGRADIVQEQALFEALQTNSTLRAALDVWYIYHPEADERGRHYPFSYPFHELENVIISPHRADSPFDDRRRWDDIIENIKRMADGRTDFINLVDIQAGY